MGKMYSIFFLAIALCFNAGAQLVQPIRLSEFKGQLSGKDGSLKWKTLSEENVSHFEIERSTDGQSFFYRGSVTAAGNTSQEKQYGYADKDVTALGASIIYYRLKMKDTDGAFDYSRIIAINVKNGDAVVMLYPNPAKESATLMISVTRKEKITYTIIDKNGNSVRQKTFTAEKGSNNIPVETNSLAAGVYTISLQGQFTNTKLKLVKQ